MRRADAEREGHARAAGVVPAAPPGRRSVAGSRGGRRTVLTDFQQFLQSFFDVVVSMLRTILVAVPALSRVEPAITSGPTPGAIVRSTKVCSSVRGSHVTKMIFDCARRARVSAPRTNCVIPLADTPMTTSFLV